MPVQLAVPSVSAKVIDFTPLHSSVAITAPVLFVVAATVHSSVMLAGQVMTESCGLADALECTTKLMVPEPVLSVSRNGWAAS